MNKPKWGDVFQDPDAVGSSEYRALHDLLADVTELSHGLADPDPEAEITEEKRTDMLSVLNELEGWTETVRTALLKLHT
jgi:hypothetical protein